MTIFRCIRSLGALAAIMGLLLVSCVKDKDYMLSDPSANPVPDAIDPGEGASNVVLTLTGSGLGGIQTILFDNSNIIANFNPAFNTDQALIFQVPVEAVPGEQHIVFTNRLGKSFSVPFKVLALPLITSVSNYNFAENSTITLTGKYLDDVSSVSFTGTSTELTVVDKTATTLIVSFPATDLIRTKLTIVNTAGATTTDDFVNLDLAYGIFKDAMGPNIEDWSWGTSNSVSTDNVKSGAASFKAGYSGSWGGVSLHFSTPLDITPYKYVSFWIKGGAVDKVLQFNFNWGAYKSLAVPASVWTYYKIELTEMGASSLTDWVMQIEGDPEVMYMDDLILIK